MLTIPSFSTRRVTSLKLRHDGRPAAAGVDDAPALAGADEVGVVRGDLGVHQQQEFPGQCDVSGEGPWEAYRG